MQTIDQFYPELTSSPKKVVITMHQKPDGDAMGSALALYNFLVSLGHEVTVLSPTNWSRIYDWMPGCDKVINYEIHKNTGGRVIGEMEWLFCLDFNVLSRTKLLEPLLLEANCTKVLIDHHELPQVEQFNYGISMPCKSSTCEMVYDFIMDSGHADKLTVEIAECIYTGLMTDTGSFRFPSSTASTHKAVAHLKELGLQHAKVHERIYDNFLENRLRFIGNALLNRMHVLYEYNTALMVIPMSDVTQYNLRTGDTEGLVNYLLTIDGIKFGALLIDRGEEGKKWSFRSKGNFDVNAFARAHFDGGGHVNAAGGKSMESIEEAEAKLKEVLKLYQNQLLGITEN